MLSLANQATAQNSEKLKSIQWAIGSWQQATKQEGKSRDWQFQFTANRNAILISQFMNKDNQTKAQLDALFGWDKNSQEIVGHGFFTGGGAAGGWTLEIDSSKFTIRSGSSEWKFEKNSKEELILEHKSRQTKYRRSKPKDTQKKTNAKKGS